jgi:asparagine synthase (glutamine-hydrolysing)
LGQRARWLDEVAGAEGGRRYALMTTHFRFGPVEKRAIYGPVLRREVATQDALAALAEPFEQAPAPDDLHRMLYCDMLTRLPEHTLLLADRMTMAHGLEARSPLLDHELAEFCGAMPARLKVRRGITKFALRRAARSWLPPETLRRPKQGFMLPIACWLDDAELGDVTATLRAGALAREGWIDGAGVDRLIAEHRRRRADHHVRIWMLLSLEAWYRIYMDGESVDGVTEHGVAARNAAS